MRNISFKIIPVIMAVALMLSSCEQDNIGPVFDDLGSFTGSAFSKAIKQNDNVIKVGVTHRNHTKNSQLRLILEPAGSTPAALATLASDVVTFTNSDTVWVDVAINYAQLADDGFYNFTIRIADGEEGYLEPMQYGGGIKKANISFSKYIPLDRAPFLGSYLELDGEDEYPVTITADPADEFTLIVSGGNWGSGASYKVRFNTNTRITIVDNQFLGVNYPGIGGAAGQVFYRPIAGKNGTFNTTTGEFSVWVNMILPNYPYNFGNYELLYVKD
jgi:hypothetical protein